MRFWRGEGVTRDKALGDAWLRRAQASLTDRPGWKAYAAAAKVVEARVRTALTEAEHARDDLLTAHLLATVPDMTMTDSRARRMVIFFRHRANWCSA